MKRLFPAFALMLLCSCQKEINLLTERKSAELTASNVLQPLKYHAITFNTNYPPPPVGRVPLYNFIKTQYADSRVKSLHLVIRGFPNVPDEVRTQYNTLGDYKTLSSMYIVYDLQFSYSTNKASVIGTRTAVTIIPGQSTPAYFQKDSMNHLEFNFNSDGYCYSINNTSYGFPIAVFTAKYESGKLTSFNSTYHADLATGGYGNFQVTNDANGNITKIIRDKSDPEGDNSEVEVDYAYNKGMPGKRYFYQTTQYALSFWYNLLEVMQWLPPAKNERASVTLKVNTFQYTDPNDHTKTKPYTLLQGQRYYNHKYDKNDNLISYTYGDNVLQKITWK